MEFGAGRVGVSRAESVTGVRYDIGMDNHTSPSTPLVVDCSTCAMEGTSACDDCVVTHLFAAGGPLCFDDDERDALAALADEGLVPRLRLVPRSPRRAAG